ncbi:MAG: hypothetical protein EBR09_02380 [Proteobacteria bacterium]|nr:hypothetical protein [Pseudomonadota bacterium]
MRIPLFLAVAVGASSPAYAGFSVHEWGTFTSLVGADGSIQQGMFGEDEQLPQFVHNFGERPPNSAPPPPSRSPSSPAPACPGAPKLPCEFLIGQTITQKMETPVVYFYSDEPLVVNFSVSFPKGIISQSFPKATRWLPHAEPGVAFENGYASYAIQILKGESQAGAIPPVNKDNIYSHARNVASNLIRAGGETERFIFYRGLGNFNSELHSTSTGNSLKFVNNGDTIPAVFLLSTDGNGRGNILSLGQMSSAEVRNIPADTVSNLQLSPVDDFLPAARSLLHGALMNAGLFSDEATAMLDTWEHGYLKTPGLRVLYVLNPREVERILPANISPVPDTFSRAFIGRLEILLDSQEALLLQQIEEQQEDFSVGTLGRMAYPTLMRIRERARSQGRLTATLDKTIDALIQKIQ